MPSARRFRGFVPAAFVLFLLLCYYSGYLDFGHPGLAERVTLAPPPLKDVSGESVLEPPIPVSSTPSVSSLSSSTSSASAIKATETPSTASQLYLDSSDVLLIFKTGASTIWRRMPLQLTTTLANGRAPNSVVYSDMSEQLASNLTSIDTLSNVSSLVQRYDPAAYSSYLELKAPQHVNTYREHAGLPGDEPLEELTGNPPGWLLDKYKFLPMLTHAQQTWPGLKWYIYIEDDSFIFLDNLLQWLAALSPDDKPSWYGAFSGEGTETFAQGGSGLVFSRSLMKTIFGGGNIPDLEKYGNYTASACCGDIILGKVLRDQGVPVNRGEYGPISFRPEPPWKTGFETFIWCTPVFTFHHLHQRDLVQLAELERAHRESTISDRPIIFRDIYTAIISPSLVNASLPNWDNFASRYILTSNSTGEIPITILSHDAITFNRAFQTPDTCRSACLGLPECLSWRHDLAAGQCALDVVVRLGRECDPLPKWAPETEIVSGWLLDRIEKTLLADKCEVVAKLWEPPSV